MDAVGMRAGLFGNESGTFEAWVYPLKILRRFHLIFHIEGRAIPAESLARTVEIRPESSTVVYAADAFRVRETWFVPLREMGAVALLEVDSHVPVQIEAAFEPDMQLMWPGGLGGTYVTWDKVSQTFVLGEEQKRYFAILGAPGSTLAKEQYADNYSASRESSVLLGEVKGSATKLVVIAGSVKSREEAEATYRGLIDSHPRLLEEAAAYYQEYLDHAPARVARDAVDHGDTDAGEQQDGPEHQPVDVEIEATFNHRS
jgi:hypothetical protein